VRYLQDRASLSLGARQKVREAASLVHARVQKRQRLGIKNLIMPLLVQSVYSKCLSVDSLGSWPGQGNETLWLPRFHFQRTKVVKERIQIGIFAGIHGDEPGGILGVMDFLRELDEHPELGRDFEIWVYPICNPGGCTDGTRNSRSGYDLNRQFWKNSTQPEVRLLEDEIRRRNFDGIIALHSDDTAEGFYGYARGALLAADLLAPALTRVEQVISLDHRSTIDGFEAFNGMISGIFDGVLRAPEDQKAKPFELILESPEIAPLADQRRAFCLALESIITTYRSFIVYGANL
jgi:protein MpaA